MSETIRELKPAAAWCECERRACVLGVIGFLMTGILQTFGAVPGFSEPLPAALSGLVAFYFVSLTLSLAYYHGTWRSGIEGAIIAMIVPFGVNLVWVRFSSMSALIPTIVMGLVLYILLNIRHLKGSRQPAGAYSRELERIDAKEFLFESRPKALAFGAIIALGIIAVFWLLFISR